MDNKKIKEIICDDCHKKASSPVNVYKWCWLNLPYHIPENQHYKYKYLINQNAVKTNECKYFKQRRRVYDE